MGERASRLPKRLDPDMMVFRTVAFRALPGILLITLALLWPALLSGAPLAFFDTQPYYNHGIAAWNFVFQTLGLGGGGGEAAPVGGDDGIIYGVRSVPYSLFAYGTSRIASFWAPVVLSAFTTAVLIWLALPTLRPRTRTLVGIALAFATVMAFYAAQFQPDILAAHLILVPVILMMHGKGIGPWGTAALLLVMAFAAVAHYSHVPLALATGLMLGVWAFWHRRSALVVLAQLPVVAALASNLLIGLVIDGGPSLAPGRFPLLLARSVADGPGLDFLQERCPEADYAVCEVFDEIPDNVQDFLWSDRSVVARATPEQLLRIGAEEVPLLIEILRYDPIGQTGALVRNAVAQLFLVGRGGGQAADYAFPEGRMVIELLDDRAALFDAIEWMQVGTLLIALGVAIVVLRRGTFDDRAILALVVFAILANAAVCGGLSAPAERYGGRLVWVLPLVVIALFARQRSRET